MTTRRFSSRHSRFFAVGLCLGLVAGASSPAGEPSYSAAVLEDEPLYYWSFDEPGDFEEAVNLVDPTKPEDRLTPQGTVRRVNHEDIGSDPILGRCAEFDGAMGTRFYAPDLGGGAVRPGADLIPSQLWAVEFWFKVEGTTAGNRSDYFLESIGMGSSNNPGLIYDYTPDDYIEMFRGARTGTAGPQVSDNEWHHIVFAFYGNSAGFGVANRRDIVLDGSVYTDRDSAFSSGFALVEIAIGNTVAAGGVNGFEGLIDEFAIYDVGTKLAEMGFDTSTQNPDAEAEFEAFVLDLAGHAEIAAKPGYGDAILAAGPLFYWNFDEPGDKDPAVNVADPDDPRDLLQAQGGATRVDHAAIGSGLALGRAASFDGANGTRFYAPDIDGSSGPPVLNQIPSGLWAAEFWFQVLGATEGSRQDYFIECIGLGQTNNPGLIYDYTPENYIEIFGPGGRTGTAGPQVGDGSWHHIIFAFYGDSAGRGVANRRDIILDGRTFTERTSGFSSPFALVEIAVGNTVAGGGQNGFEGRMDELALYDIGAKLAAKGFDISKQNEEAEAAFAAILADIAEHRRLVSGGCTEEPDSVAISGPSLGTLGGAGVTLSASFTGADPGGAVTYSWSVVSGQATISAQGAQATVIAGEAGSVVVEVSADDGVCTEFGEVKARQEICFETPDSVTISGPAQAQVGETVALSARVTGLDPKFFVDRTSAFSSGFGLIQIALGNSVGGVDPFEGRMDEVALYDVGTMLQEQGFDISTQNPEAEAAFEEIVRRIASHAKRRGPDYVDAVFSEGPILYWTFDEPGDTDPAVNFVAPDDPNDWLTPRGGATRGDHDAIGSGLDLGRFADFDGAFGTSFYAPDLKGGGGGPGVDYVASQLWVLEFWFQVKGSTEGDRHDYFLEAFGPGGSNDPGIIYDFTPPDYIEMFRGARTGTAGPQVRDNSWHHAVFAFYGNSGGFGVANRREIILDGGDFATYSWTVVSGDATIVDRGGGVAEVVANSEGTVVVRVEAGDGLCAEASAEHTIVFGGAGPIFHRGDANGDGAMNITDGIFVLNYLFLGGDEPGCLEAANPNDDDALNITDGIYILNYLFLGGPEPAPPGPPGEGPCGPDPATGSFLGCASYEKC